MVRLPGITEKRSSKRGRRMEETYPPRKRAKHGSRSHRVNDPPEKGSRQAHPHAQPVCKVQTMVKQKIGKEWEHMYSALKHWKVGGETNQHGRPARINVTPSSDQSRQRREYNASWALLYLTAHVTYKRSTTIGYPTE